MYLLMETAESEAFLCANE